MIKILIIGNFSTDKNCTTLGGVETAILGFLNGIEVDNSFEYIFLSIREDNKKKQVIQYQKNIKIYQIPIKYKIKLIDIFLNGRYWVKKLVENEKPSLIHFIGSGPTLFYVPRKLRNISIVTQHGIMSEELKYTSGLRNKLKFLFKVLNDKTILKKFKKRIFISEYNKNIYNEKYLDKYSIIPNALTLDLIQKNIDIDKNTSLKKIILIGNISKLKNQELAINLFRELNEKGIECFKLCIIGKQKNKKYYKEIKDSIEKNNLTGKIEICGSLNYKDTLQRIIKSDILLVTSLHEHKPMVISEAMSLGKVVIAPAVGGIPEMIQNGKNGFLYSKNNLTELNKIFISIYSNELDVVSIKNTAHRFTQNNYHPSGIVEKTNSFYRDVNKSKIAVIGLKGLPAFGGAAAVGENIIEELKVKYDFTVYSISSHTDNSSGKYNGYNLVVFRSLFRKHLNIVYYYIVSAIHALLFSSYDLIHLHHRDASFILILLKLKYKVILTTHGMVLTSKWSRFTNIFNIQDQIFLHFADKITCVSKKDKYIVEEKVSQSVVHIPNGVRLNIGIANIFDSREYLMFGANRIIPSKGCHIFLKAMQNIKWNNKILIAGDLNQQLEYMNELLHLSKYLTNVEFLGLIKNKNELDNYILNSKLFVYPSEIESMSMMLLEVASLKTPIICCDIPENKEIFDDDEVIYFKTNNVDDLSQKIDWALNNEELINKNAEKAFNKLKDHYLWKDISLQYEKVYEQLLN